MTGQLQLRLVHDTFRRFSTELYARTQPRSIGQMPDVLVITDGSPCLRREPFAEFLRLRGRPSLPGWHRLGMAAGGQEDVLEGRHRVKQASRSEIKVNAISDVHRVGDRHRLSIPHWPMDGVVEDDTEMREAEMFDRTEKPVLEWIACEI